MTALAHATRAAPASAELIPMIDRGIGIDGGRSESVKTVRGVLVALALVAPFWMGVLEAIALLAR